MAKTILTKTQQTLLNELFLQENIRKYFYLSDGFDTPIEPLQLAQALTEASVLKDFPRMLIPLNPEEWQNFWLDQSKLLKNEVLK